MTYINDKFFCCQRHTHLRFNKMINLSDIFFCPKMMWGGNKWNQRADRKIRKNGKTNQAGTRKKINKTEKKN